MFPGTLCYSVLPDGFYVTCRCDNCLVSLILMRPHTLTYSIASNTVFSSIPECLVCVSSVNTNGIAVEF